jgi:hypothetical protein
MKAGKFRSWADLEIFTLVAEKVEAQPGGGAACVKMAQFDQLHWSN